MSSFTKITSQLTLLGVVLLIIIYHSLRNSEYADNEKESVESQVVRFRRAIQSTTTHYCRPNQYYDQDEGRCLGVPGGGKVLHIDNGHSCGINILKPHCKNPLYYHICKSSKSILAQCPSNQIFDNRHQRCVYYDTSKLTPSTIRPDNHQHYDHVQVPNCTKPGQFPVPDQCSMFYSCESNGHRLYQSVFKCPRNTGYQVDKGACAILPGCENDDSVDSKVCVSDAPKELVESPNSNEATEQITVETTSERAAETTSINDSLVKREKNENDTYTDIVSTTPVIDNPARDHENNNTDTDNTLNSNVTSSTPSAEEASFSGDTDETTIFQATRSTESTRETFDETQKEDELASSLGIQVTSPATSEFDNDALHSTVTFITTTEYNANNMNTTVDNETTDTALFSSVGYTSSELDDRTHDATTEQYRNDRTEAELNSSIETIIDPYLSSTASDILELSSSINDASTQLDEEKQNTTTEQYKTDDDATETLQNSSTEADLYLTSTVSDILEFSSINASTQFDEETQNTTTEQYKTDDDATETLQNSSTVADPYLTSTVSDIPEFSLTNDPSTQFDEETQNTTTEQYKTDDDATETLQNSSTEADSYLTSTVSDIPEFSSINNASTQFDEETQNTTTEQYKTDEDATETLQNSSTEAGNPYLTSTVSDIPEFSSINDTSTQLDKETRNITTEQYKTDNNVTEAAPNLSTEAVDPHLTSAISDVPEYFSGNDTSTQLEEAQSATTEQYKDDNRPATNFTTEVINQGLTSEVNDVPVTTSNPYSNAFDTLTSASNTIVSQNIVNVTEPTAEELSGTTLSIDSKSVNTDLRETGEITTQYLYENTDNLAATTIASFILGHTTAPIDTTVTSTIRDISDLVIQNSTGGLPD